MTTSHSALLPSPHNTPRKRPEQTRPSIDVVGTSHRHANSDVFVSVWSPKLELQAVVSLDQHIDEGIERDRNLIGDPASERREENAHRGSDTIQSIRGERAARLLLQFVFTKMLRCTAVGCSRSDTIAFFFWQIGGLLGDTALHKASCRFTGS